MSNYFNNLSSFKKVAIYVRESTKKQDWKSQLLQLQKRAKDMSANVVLEYVDIGSGKLSTRKNYLKLKEDIGNKKIDLVMFWELSRSNRDLKEHLNLMSLMISNEVSIFSLTDGGVMNPADINNKLNLNLKAVINANESEVNAQRVRNRSFFLSEQGHWLGGPVPYGYISHKGVLQEYEIESENVKRIFEMFLDGELVIDIARTFNLERKRITRILKNVIYIGYVKYGETRNFENGVIPGEKKIHKGKHKAIIDTKKFEIAQNLLEAQKGKRVPTELSVDYLFGGIIQCWCGCTMYGWKDPKGNTLYYKCSSSWKLGKSCGKKVVAIQSFEDQVLDLVLKLDFTLEDEGVADNSEERTNSLKKGISTIIRQEKFLLDKLISSVDDITRLEIYQAKLDFLSIERLKLEKELDNLKNFKPKPLESKKIDKLFLNEYLEKIKIESNREQLRKLLRTLINSVVFINDFRIHIFFNFMD